MTCVSGVYVQVDGLLWRLRKQAMRHRAKKDTQAEGDGKSTVAATVSRYRVKEAERT